MENESGPTAGSSTNKNERCKLIQHSAIINYINRPVRHYPAQILLRDILLWKKKKQSVLVLLIATATWVLLEVYQFKFLTVVAWATMAIVSSLFLWGNMFRFFNKESPNLLRMVEMTEVTAPETAYTTRTWTEEGIRWMFRVAAEREWFVFAGNVIALWLLSCLGRHLDLLTSVYTGIVMAMTMPVIYGRYKENMKRSEEWVKAQARRYYDMVDNKVVRNIRKVVLVTEDMYKDNKVE